MANLLYHNEQTDVIQGAGGHMSTTVQIYDDGKLYANTHIWEDTVLRGFHGGVFVVLFDEHDDKWTTVTQIYGVDGRWVGPSDRTEQWQDQVPPDIMSTAKRIAIVHKWAPHGAQQEIQNYLNAIKTDTGLVAGIIQDLVKIAAPKPAPTPTPAPPAGGPHGKIGPVGKVGALRDL